jgi:hypothetical protein
MQTHREQLMLVQPRHRHLISGHFDRVFGALLESTGRRLHSNRLEIRGILRQIEGKRSLARVSPDTILRGWMTDATEAQ